MNTNIVNKKVSQYHHAYVLTLFKMGGTKRPPTSFSPVTSTNVGVSPQNFLTFSFNTFASLV